ncbi:MAG: hypothetical protein ACTSWV_05635, partial [Candidatus Asgardarchaeia archaeon]
MSRKRGLSAESLAKIILKMEGYDVLEERKKVRLNGEEVAEIDLIVKDKLGETYAVEVKAGDVDVSAVRNVYTNSKILDMKGMIIGRKFSNKSAEILARKLGISYIMMGDYFMLMDPTELNRIVREAFLDTVSGLYIFPASIELKDEFLEELKVIANFSEGDKRKLERSISNLKRNLIIPKGMRDLE